MTRVVTLPLPVALHGTVAARLAGHHLRFTPRGAQLTAFADALEAALPPTIPQSVLADALGVTPKTVKQWVDRGKIPLEQPRPGARPGVPAAFALTALERSDLLRRPLVPELPHGRITGRAVHPLRRLPDGRWTARPW